MSDAAKPVKNDQGKLRFDLFPPAAHVAVVRGLSYGAIKYSDRNYATGAGLKYTRLIAALERHLIAWKSGVDYDRESGLHHLDHVGSCWAMLADLAALDRGVDDRVVVKGLSLEPLRKHDLREEPDGTLVCVICDAREGEGFDNHGPDSVRPVVCPGVNIRFLWPGA